MPGTHKPSSALRGTEISRIHLRVLIIALLYGRESSFLILWAGAAGVKLVSTERSVPENFKQGCNTVALQRRVIHGKVPDMSVSQHSLVSPIDKAAA